MSVRGRHRAQAADLILIHGVNPPQSEKKPAATPPQNWSARVKISNRVATVMVRMAYIDF